MSSSSPFQPILVECPHCTQTIEIVEKNCCIFRCGIYKKNYKQIDPHLPKDACVKLVNQSKIYGCGKPFRIENTGADSSIPDVFTAVACDYI